MATSLTTSLSLRGSSIIKAFSGGGTAPLRFGNYGMAKGTFSLFDGTGATQSNVAFVKDFTILTTANLDIDLTSGQTDASGAAVVMTSLKWIYFELTNPAATDKIRIGPQGVTNAIQLWFQAATTNFWTEAQMYFQGFSNYAGLTVDATHKVIRLHNPGASTVNGYFLAGGVQ